ncbi:MAG: ABC transporter ATP-binding protein [candidate division WOR-3 bacterium]
MAEPIISLSNIYAGYSKRQVLHGISMDIYPGEIICLIGPNGAGKSTLLKTILGDLAVIKGSIVYEGKDISNCPMHERINMGWGYFIQGGQIFNNLSVEENLEMGGVSLGKKEYNWNIKQVFNLFPRLELMKKKRAGQLSGGERQMLALGIILIKRPNLLLLDEPSAGLSPDMSELVFAKIKEINRIFASTILLVEQNIIKAVSISNKFYIMKDGILAAESMTEKDGRYLLKKEDTIFAEADTLLNLCRTKGFEKLFLS